MDHVLRRALHHEQTRRTVINERGDAAPLEIEGDFVDLAPGFYVDLSMGENRVIKRALDTALKGAIEISQPKYCLAVVTAGVYVASQANLGLRERPCLIGAENVHGAEIVDRGKALHNNATLGEPSCPVGQSHGHDHGQQLGSEPNGERQSEQQGFEPRAIEHHVSDHHEQDEENRQAQHQETELPNALRECISRPLRREADGKSAQLRGTPRPTC